MPRSFRRTTKKAPATRVELRGAIASDPPPAAEPGSTVARSADGRQPARLVSSHADETPQPHLGHPLPRPAVVAGVACCGPGVCVSEGVSEMSEVVELHRPSPA